MLLEVLALEVLHGDVRQALVLAELVDGDDVAVVEPAGGLGLALEAGDQLGVADRGLAHHLDRGQAVDRRVPALVDHAEGAAADLLEDLELADFVHCAARRRLSRKLRDYTSSSRARSSLEPGMAETAVGGDRLPAAERLGPASPRPAEPPAERRVGEDADCRRRELEPRPPPGPAGRRPRRRRRSARGRPRPPSPPPAPRSPSPRAARWATPRCGTEGRTGRRRRATGRRPGPSRAGARAAHCGPPRPRARPGSAPPPPTGR